MTIPETSANSPKPQMTQKSPKIKNEIKKTKPNVTSKTNGDRFSRKKVKSNPEPTQSEEKIVIAEPEVEPCQQLTVEPCQQVDVEPCAKMKVEHCEKMKVGVKRSTRKTNSSPTKRKKK